MPTPTKKPKILAIIGPTASGKSDLAVVLAKKYNGEVVSVDSRQVYRGLDIGSGKITKTEMKGVPHHLIDVANPKRVFSAAQFVEKGTRAIEDIVQRGKLPILAGGTGFYLSALLGEISLPHVPPNEMLRKKLETHTLPALIKKLEEMDPERANTIDLNNRVRVVRAIEIANAIGNTPRQTSVRRYTVLKIGIDTTLEDLEVRIEKRLHVRLRRGMLAEARKLHTQRLSWKRMESLGLEYRYMARHLKGDISKEEMNEAILTKSRQYAKRQMMWFKRDKDINWFTLREVKKVEKLVDTFLTP